MKRIAVGILLAFVISGIAKADIMIALNSGPVVNGANFNWTYTATLKSGSTLNNGDFFTIYDIGGFGVGVPVPINVIIPGGNWSYSIQFTGTNGFSQAPVDSNIGYNVTYRYIGASPIVAASDTVLGGGAGAFGYTSSHNTAATSAYSATTHVTSGGAPAGNASTVTVAGGPYDAIFRDDFE
jgi:hypothetical protein